MLISIIPFGHTDVVSTPMGSSTGSSLTYQEVRTVISTMSSLPHTRFVFRLIRLTKFGGFGQAIQYLLLLHIFTAFCASAYSLDYTRSQMLIIFFFGYSLAHYPQLTAISLVNLLEMKRSWRCTHHTEAREVRCGGRVVRLRCVQ